MKVAAAAGPRLGMDEPYTSGRSCVSVRAGPKGGGYLSWIGADPDRDPTSNFDEHGELYYCGNDLWEGCVDGAHWVGTCEEGTRHRWVDSCGQRFHDDDDDENSTYKAGGYHLLEVSKHVGRQGSDAGV